MKRFVRNPVTVVEFEWDIEIISSTYFSIYSSTDLTDTEYDNFITSMLAQFKMAHYNLSYDEEFTHDSNFPGSLSEYFTFTRWYDDVQVIVVVNVRISDHPDKAKYGKSARRKRAEYVAKLGNKLSEGLDPSYTATYPLEIIFDDKHLKSFSSAQFLINSNIKKIESEIQDILEGNL